MPAVPTHARTMESAWLLAKTRISVIAQGWNSMVTTANTVSSEDIQTYEVSRVYKSPQL